MRAAYRQFSTVNGGVGSSNNEDRERREPTHASGIPETHLVMNGSEKSVHGCELGPFSVAG